MAGRPTIRPRGATMDLEEVMEKAEAMHNACDGCGTNERTVMELLVSLNNAQRQQLRDAYQSYGEDLIEMLKGEFSGDMEDMIVGLMTPSDEYEARLLHDAISGPGTAEDTITEILCTRNNEELEAIKEKYQELFEVSLADDLDGEVAGEFGHMVSALVKSGRQPDVDDDYAFTQAKKLQDAGVECWGTDEMAFNVILTSSCDEQIRRIMEAYKNETGSDLVSAIESEFSGELKDGYAAMLKCAYSKPRYFAERLHKCMQGFGTDETELIRILVSRAEIDLEDIKEVYPEFADQSLFDHVNSEVSGRLGKLMKCLIVGGWFE